VVGLWVRHSQVVKACSVKIFGMHNFIRRAGSLNGYYITRDCRVSLYGYAIPRSRSVLRLSISTKRSYPRSDDAAPLTPNTVDNASTP